MWDKVGRKKVRRGDVGRGKAEHRSRRLSKWVQMGSCPLDFSTLNLHFGFSLLLHRRAIVEPSLFNFCITFFLFFEFCIPFFRDLIFSRLF